MAAMDALWHRVANGRPYALVLLDARMPDADGLTVAAKIRERAELAATRIILLTSGERPGGPDPSSRAADRRPAAQAGPAGRAARNDLPRDESVSGQGPTLGPAHAPPASHPQRPSRQRLRCTSSWPKIMS